MYAMNASHRRVALWFIHMYCALWARANGTGYFIDQPPALLAVADPKIAVPELELVQVHLHVGTRPALCRHLHLVVRRLPCQLRRFSCGINYLPAPLRLERENMPCKSQHVPPAVE
jgi:hypothetical protein